jgi:hypothetical protein
MTDITERPNRIDLKTQDQITKDAESSSNKSLEIEKIKLERDDAARAFIHKLSVCTSDDQAAAFTRANLP